VLQEENMEKKDFSQIVFNINIFITMKGPNNTLSAKQKEQLQKHKVHHTAKHMTMMRKLMREGMSFTKAHNKTMKEIGS